MPKSAEAANHQPVEQPAAQPADAPAENRRTLLVLFGGVLLGALDIAIVGPALPAIRIQFELSAPLLSWVFSVYILFGLIGAPLNAAASDRYGRRSVYLFCLSLFGVGSLTVAFATSFELLLCGRAVQAFGAGGLLPVAAAVIADTFPEEKRGRALGLIGAVFGVAFILGPLLGGLLLRYSWRWLFLINVPLIAGLLIAAARVLPAAAAGAVRQFDWRGAITLTIGLIALVFGTTSFTAEPRAWLSAASLGWTFCAVAAAVAFWLIERQASDPILHPSLFDSTQMRVISLMSLATGMVEAGMVFLPALAVTAFAVPASTASLMLMPLVASLIVGSIVAGRAIDRIGAKPVVQFGTFTTVVGLALFALLELNIISFYLAGLAVGLGLSSLLGAPLRYLALHVGGASRRGASQGLLALMLGTGRMLGAALIGGVVAAGSSELSGYRRAMLLLALACSLSLVASVWLRPDRSAGGSESARRT